MVGTLERKVQERSASPGTGRGRTHKEDAAAGAGNIAVSRSFATHHFTFEHKSATVGTANGPQFGVAGPAAAHLPPALDWLQRKPAVVQAAAAEPEPEQAEPQINIAQLQEIIKKLPQFDVKKLADRVYRELEKKLRFERQTRGL
jgi:ribosomal protein L15